MEAPALPTIVFRVTARFESFSTAITCPVPPIAAANCVVLLPGAAHASRTVASCRASNRSAGMQLALSCRMTVPDEYSCENKVVRG